MIEMRNYEALQETHGGGDVEDEDNVLVHVAEPSRARWNHIEDLDSFFARMYHYHQRHGYFCMLLQEVLELCQFVFVVILTIYLFHGINYPVLFKDQPPSTNTTKKVTLNDVILTPSQCIANFHLLSWLFLIIVILVWCLKLLKGLYTMFLFWDIKQFFNTALHIDDSELDNLTWHEVQSRVRVVQIEQQMCIHKRELTELDIYHRILRQQNYLVALVNKKLLPPRLRIPLIGEVVYWTTGLRYNLHLLLFWSPWSPFANPWHLKDDYKKANRRQELSKQFGRKIRFLALANFVLAPLILLWNVLYAFFSYAAIVRKEPSILAKRRWSLYGRLYLRHFNELEHELQARLTRAYKPATKYLAAFSSPFGTILAESAGFFATAILAIFVVLSLWDEDVLTVEHVLTIITLLTILVAMLRNIAPDETTPWDPEKLLANVVKDTHYLPGGWAGQAHTMRIRREFEQLFQYGFVALIEGVLAPLLTPYVLWFHIWPRALDFVDFFRNFTVSVVGVGDVCSFAQMDVRKHGHPDWQMPAPIIGGATANNQYTQGEEGKVELSLIHFTCTNPSWKPPVSVQDFVRNVQSSIVTTTNDIFPSAIIGDVTANAQPGSSVLQPEESVFGDEAALSEMMEYKWRLRASRTTTPMHASGMWRAEGPSLTGARDMAASATFLHTLHHSRTIGQQSRQQMMTSQKPAQESTPLLFTPRDDE